MFPPGDRGDVKFYNLTMRFLKFISAGLLLVIVFVFSACKKKDTTKPSQENQSPATAADDDIYFKEYNPALVAKTIQSFTPHIAGGSPCYKPIPVSGNAGILLDLDGNGTEDVEVTTAHSWEQISVSSCSQVNEILSFRSIDSTYHFLGVEPNPRYYTISAQPFDSAAVIPITAPRLLNGWVTIYRTPHKYWFGTYFKKKAGNYYFAFCKKTGWKRNVGWIKVELFADNKILIKETAFNRAFGLDIRIGQRK